MAALVSIVIPTRERAFYLRHCLQTVLDIEDPDIEVLVSNNASTDDTAAVLAGFSDPRLRVLTADSRISMRQNFEFALGHCRGDYVIYIGDDDAFLPGQFAVFRHIIETHRPDSLSWSLPTYGWAAADFVGKSGGVRLEKRLVYGALQPVDNARLRAQLMTADFEGFLPPTIYHGAARRELMERHRAANGVFFNGTSPDLYFTYLAILTGAAHMHVSHPVTISGKSAASTGAAHNSKAIKQAADNPAARFAAENSADPMRDVVDLGVSVRGAFFQVLETVRGILGVTELPDYAAWFRFVLADHKSHSAAEHADIVSRLRAYAGTAGQTAALERVLREGAGRISRRRLAARWDKARSKLRSFRVRTGLEGTNTVHSAAKITDIILGDGFVPALGQAPEQARRWRDAVRRARPYPKQL